MKRFFIILSAMALASTAASAQDAYFAEMISRNNYYGTARSIALGGAMTALGGDLGSIMYNPAGSAVNDYCQFTISPGILFSGTKASFDPKGFGSDFGSPTRTTHAKFNIPNIGLNLVFFSDDSNWITSTSIGVVANTSNTYLRYSTARGVNEYTSFLGSLASAADGFAVKEFGRDHYAAYYGNQIGEYGPEGSLRYVGASQVLHPDGAWAYIPGAINQAAIYNTYGTKTDLAFNLGFNVLDRFYFGFNLGVPSLNYRRQEIFSEAAQHPELFPVIFEGKEGELYSTNFKGSSNTFRLDTDGLGINATFGFIALITESFRLGASIKTPTSFRLNESWDYRASTSYEMSSFDSSAKSSEGTASYRLRTPYVFDAGLAYTIAGAGLISIDYELTDYSIMKYSDNEYDYFGEDAWASKNYINQTFMGVSHSVRAGVEFKPLPFLALRAGYSFISDPEKYWTDDSGNRITAETWQGYNQVLVNSKYFDKVTHAVSLGAGFSSSGSFFADFAVRLTAYPDSMYSPYYYGSYQAFDKDGLAINAADPLIRISHNMVDTVLTLGWRF